jgi:hypothetical protein
LFLVNCKGLSGEIFLCIPNKHFYWAFKRKTEGQENTLTAVLREARELVSDVHQHFTWETDGTVYQRVEGVAKRQHGTIQVYTGA